MVLATDHGCPEGTPDCVRWRVVFCGALAAGIGNRHVTLTQKSESAGVILAENHDLRQDDKVVQIRAFARRVVLNRCQSVQGGG